MMPDQNLDSFKDIIRGDCKIQLDIGKPSDVFEIHFRNINGDELVQFQSLDEPIITVVSDVDCIGM